MTATIKILLSAVLGNKQFVETLFSWISLKILGLLEKKVGKFEKGKIDVDNINKVIRSINRIQSALDVVKTLANQMTEPVITPNGEKVEVIPLKPKPDVSATPKGVKSEADTFAIKTVGIKALKRWSKKQPTPQEYKESAGTFG